MPSANIEEEGSEAKRERYMEIVDDPRYKLSSLTCLFHLKRKYMTDLEIVNALHHMLFNGGHPLSLLVSWLHKLSILYRCVGTTHRLQFQLLSRLLYRAHGERYGLLSNKSVREAFQDMRRGLIFEVCYYCTRSSILFTSFLSRESMLSLHHLFLMIGDSLFSLVV
jgi:hypothetical protein